MYYTYIYICMYVYKYIYIYGCIISTYIEMPRLPHELRTASHDESKLDVVRRLQGLRKRRVDQRNHLILVVTI